MNDRKLLNVTGILLMIWGGLILIANLMTGALNDAWYLLNFTESRTSILFELYSFTLFLSGILCVVAGYCGTHQRPESGMIRTCIALGYATVIATIARFVLQSLTLQPVGLLDLVSCILNLVLPMLYVYSARKIRAEEIRALKQNRLSGNDSHIHSGMSMA